MQNVHHEFFDSLYAPILIGTRPIINYKMTISRDNYFSRFNIQKKSGNKKVSNSFNPLNLSVESKIFFSLFALLILAVAGPVDTGGGRVSLQLLPWLRAWC